MSKTVSTSSSWCLVESRAPAGRKTVLTTPVYTCDRVQKTSGIKTAKPQRNWNNVICRVRFASRLHRRNWLKVEFHTFLRSTRNPQRMSLFLWWKSKGMSGEGVLQRVDCTALLLFLVSEFHGEPIPWSITFRCILSGEMSHQKNWFDRITLS